MKMFMLLFLGVGLLFWPGCTSEETLEIEINSFDECANAGYPIMESYPAQCRVPGGKTFTQVLSESECSACDVDFCLASCVVCPPCKECSSIGCHSEEFCAELGFDKDWYESVKPQ